MTDDPQIIEAAGAHAENCADPACGAVHLFLTGPGMVMIGTLTPAAARSLAGTMLRAADVGEARAARAAGRLS